MIEPVNPDLAEAVQPLSAAEQLHKSQASSSHAQSAQR